MNCGLFCPKKLTRTWYWNWNNKYWMGQIAHLHKLSIIQTFRYTKAQFKTRARAYYCQSAIQSKNAHGYWGSNVYRLTYQHVDFPNIR